MSVVIGLALPDGKAAEAQGVSVHQGYTYTQRYCQELGRQPRRYNVRDPIPGSDWRNDGGWAIILVRSAGVRDTTGFRFQATGLGIANAPILSVPAQGAEQTLQVDHVDGRRGFVRYDASGNRFIYPQAGDWLGAHQVVLDLDQDGDIDLDDTTVNPFNPSGARIWQVRNAKSVTYAQAYGATYIRWANMRWCR